MKVRVRAGGAACLLAGLALLAPPAAEATTLRRMDLPELVRRADRVVHARALEKKVYYDPSGTQIHTDTLFAVLEDAKGGGPNRLTVTMFGGRIDPVEMKEEGTPIFEVGEEAVLFTSPRPDGKKGLVGFSQGRMRVVETPDGEIVAESVVPAAVHFVDTGGGRPRAVRPETTRMPLADLMLKIRQLASGQQPAGPAIERSPRKLDAPRDAGGKP